MASKLKSIFILALCFSQILSEMDYGAESLRIHEKYKGKIGVKSRVSIQDKEDLSTDYNKVMPTGKLKCLVNILDATNKYTKQKAMDKILGKVLQY